MMILSLCDAMFQMSDLLTTKLQQLDLMDGSDDHVLQKVLVVSLILSCCC